MHDMFGYRPPPAPSEPGTQTVREATFELLRAFGVDTVFGNPGSTELPMFRDFPADFRYVLGLQEASVVGMADGYAQATGNASLVNLHSAAGVGHAMGNIFTAYRNCAPMVIIAGQQARSMLPCEPFLFSSQAAELPKPYVKWSCEPARAQDVPAAIARAYHMAMQAPCGPTLVSVPVDDWDVQAEPWLPRQVSRRVAPDPAQLAQAAAALHASLRPAIVVGAGVDRDGAWQDVVALAENQGAAVWVAPASGRCSFPESHPLFCGFLPASREGIAELLQGHDFLLVLGAPLFTYHVEGQGPYVPPGAAVYQIVDDPAQAAWAPIGTAIVGHAGLSAAGLMAPLGTAVRPSAIGRQRLPAPAGGRLTPALVVHALARLRPADSILVEESPSSRAHMQAHLPLDLPGSFYACASGGLGYALPAAVGVALAQASPGGAGRRVIALLGDGSSMYSPQALWSAAQLRLPVVFIVMNNSRYQALYSFAPVFGMDTSIGSDLPGLDFQDIAHGHGCQSLRVKRAEDLDAGLRAAFAADGPVLLEIVLA